MRDLHVQHTRYGRGFVDLKSLSQDHFLDFSLLGSSNNYPFHVIVFSVSLSGNDQEQFRGFFVQARLVADDNTRTGTFGVADTTNSKLSACSPASVSRLQFLYL